VVQEPSGNDAALLQVLDVQTHRPLKNKDLRSYETSGTVHLVTKRHIPAERIPEISKSWESK